MLKHDRFLQFNHTFLYRLEPIKFFLQNIQFWWHELNWFYHFFQFQYRGMHVEVVFIDFNEVLVCLAQIILMFDEFRINILFDFLDLQCKGGNICLYFGHSIDCINAQIFYILKFSYVLSIDLAHLLLHQYSKVFLQLAGCLLFELMQHFQLFSLVLYHLLQVAIDCGHPVLYYLQYLLELSIHLYLQALFILLRNLIEIILIALQELMIDYFFVFLIIFLDNVDVLILHYLFDNLLSESNFALRLDLYFIFLDLYLHLLLFHILPPLILHLLFLISLHFLLFCLPLYLFFLFLLRFIHHNFRFVHMRSILLILTILM